MDNTTRVLSDNEGVCADCGEIFTESEKTYGQYLCEECAFTGNNNTMTDSNKDEVASEDN